MYQLLRGSRVETSESLQAGATLEEAGVVRRPPTALKLQATTVKQNVPEQVSSGYGSGHTRVQNTPPLAPPGYNITTTVKNNRCGEFFCTHTRHHIQRVPGVPGSAKRRFFKTVAAILLCAPQVDGATLCAARADCWRVWASGWAQGHFAATATVKKRP